MPKRLPKEDKSMSRPLKALSGSRDKNKQSYNFDNPDPSVLEIVPFESGNTQAFIVLKCSEFTSLCPVTGQPDFGEIVIRYTPGDKLVESKSLKLYLMGYRNSGSFHEEVIKNICLHLGKILEPRALQVHGTFKSRGGISIDPLVIWDKEE